MAQENMTKFAVDKDKTRVGFFVRHWGGMMNVKGKFNDFDFDVDFNSEDPTQSKVEVRIDASSVETGMGMRDKHLRGKDFFNAEETPQITFNSTKVESRGHSRWHVEGDLTVRGITRQVGMEIEEEDADGGVDFKGETEVNRNLFGLTWSPPVMGLLGGFFMAENATLRVEGHYTKA